MSIPTREDLEQTFLAAAIQIRPELAGSPDDVVQMYGSGCAAVGDRILGIGAKNFGEFYLDGAAGPVLVARAADKNVQQQPATASIGALTWTRPTALISETILAGTVVETAPDENNPPVQVATVADLVLAIGTLTADVDAAALKTGPGGDVDAGTLTRIRSTLSGSWTVTNADGFGGGNDIEEDEPLRERTRMKKLADREAVASALEYHARAVPGVVTVAVEVDGNGVVTIYVADRDGNSSPALVAAAATYLEDHAAAGADWQVVGGTLLEVDVVLALVARAGTDTGALFSKIAAAVFARGKKFKQNEALSLDNIKQPALSVDSTNLLSCNVVLPATGILPGAGQAIRFRSVSSA